LIRDQAWINVGAYDPMNRYERRNKIYVTFKCCHQKKLRKCTIINEKRRNIHIPQNNVAQTKLIKKAAEENRQCYN